MDEKILWQFWEIFEIFNKNSKKNWFFTILEKLLLEPSEITSFFYNIFSISKRQRSLCSPWQRLCKKWGRWNQAHLYDRHMVENLKAFSRCNFNSFYLNFSFYSSAPDSLSPIERATSRGWGTQGTSPRNWKNCCWKMMLFPKPVYLATTFPKVAKNPISLLNYYQKFTNFSQNFPTICVFCPNAKKITRGLCNSCKSLLK